MSDDAADVLAREKAELAALRLEKEMRTAAEELYFEAAARLRDQVFELRTKRDTAVNAKKRDAFAEIRASR